MQADHTDIITTDGTMECYVCHPEGGPWPAVFFYMDVPGIREELREMSRHIASHGYAVILPDLYYRDGRVRFDLAKGEAELQRMFAMGSKLTVEMIMRDTKSMIEYVKGNPNMTDRIGCVGYCMSGQFVVAAAGTFPQDIKAAASLYGVRLVTEDTHSPHLLADKIDAELYLGFAEHDPYVEDFVIPRLRATLDKNRVTYLIETHAGTEHGFCFPARPAYHDKAAQKVWERLFDLYQRNLQQTNE